ncbi:mas-related G-protein coupled receptor member H-like [Rhinatrema bivittatum]|uniref:mas-related G-protein coupled receptor member H-like n=1 Tax=Rhinatrema bivittatum TaxID=194408 RepID=UPI0011284626|nr:mas-related G-protein coupled receptor member H-like [Rhinatrema bivittatum]
MIRLSTADPSPVTAGTVQTTYSAEDMSLLELWNGTRASSDDDDDFLMWNTRIITLIAPFIALFGLVGNGIVIWFLGFRIKRNKFTVYILNLAVADFLFLLSHLMIFVFLILSNLDYFDYDIVNIQRVIVILYVFGCTISQYLLTAISAERCLSTLYPIWYHCWRPRHQSPILCAVLWALASLVAGTEHFVCIEMNSEMQPGICHAVAFFTCLLTFLVFTPIMVTSSLILLIKVRSSSLRRQPPKLYIIIVVTVALFLISSIPFRVLLFLINYYDKFPNFIFFTCSILLSTMSSCLNPFVYFYLGSRGRCRTSRSLKEVLQGIFKDETTES